MSLLLPPGKQQFLDLNGTPFAGGTVWFYVPNTSTLKDTYQDAQLTILNTNPVILDAAGRAVIWGSGAYRQVLVDISGNVIWDQETTDGTAAAMAELERRVDWLERALAQIRERA